jgi:hypothetical protein
MAQNPQIYSALGNSIYDNAKNIAYLKGVSVFSNNTSEIDIYVRDVERVKKFGLEVEKTKKSQDIKKYLFDLRNLDKRSQFFYEKANKYFIMAMRKKDNRLFLDIVESGLIDAEKNKKRIMEYYHKNCEGMQVKGVIQEYLQEEERIRLEKEKRKKMRLTKKQIQEAKIRRIRRNDRLKKEALEKKLEEELIRKKLLIREQQMRELAN